ncbi:glycosyltransferase family 1 protein [Arthrobacter sp. B10-11]|uniref:rhamnosyltransferase WsaF family glycosyltransferase n=1 Tax=Arthrobacter sp. B10-11 TaxID=3081160 RepID=UPI002952E4F9|nr:glycosyltransferase family 1 protein [Arthrobacter sp. B10-11]MDV8149802.1 glycosyltransferase family 1 protein [Arthrobacter sp. B10-11]
MTGPSILKRIHTMGTRDISRRVARRVAGNLARRFDTAGLDFPLLPEDVADSTRLQLEAPPAGNGKARLNIAWLCTPPSPGSGGHTTLFRMVAGMEARGHRCTVLLYNRHGSDPVRNTAIIRQHWPHLTAAIRPVPEVIEGYDGCVATSWDTAHVLARRSGAGTHRFYFIQDFEPFFYPRGSLYSLAEDSYRFGFHHIALGGMVAATLLENVGVRSSTVPFGCDTGVYRLENLGPRRGVVFYAREAVDRRGFLLARLALEDFHGRHPEQPIHVYGDPMRRWAVPHLHHGKLSPGQLNTLYNASLAGLAMSFTNISLVAEEMLAAGATPVVNDHRYARLDLPNPEVGWAPATPGGLADALSQVVETASGPRSFQCSAGVRQGWGGTQDAVTRLISRAVAGMPATAESGGRG